MWQKSKPQIYLISNLCNTNYMEYSLILASFIKDNLNMLRRW